MKIAIVGLVALPASVAATFAVLSAFGTGARPVLADEGRLPELSGAIGWLNSAPLTGKSLRGKVLPGGGDWTLLRSDGVLELDLRITLETDDGAAISMTSFGLRHGPPEVLAALARGESVDPSRYYFRTAPRFETSAPRYAFLNRLIAIASGDRRASGPIYTIEEIL